MLISNTEIFNSLITVYNGATTPPSGIYYTSSDFYDLLGRGEKIVLQAIIDAADQTANFNVEIQYERSNDGKVWDAPASGTFVLTFLIASPSLPLCMFIDTSAAGAEVALGAKGRFRVKTDGGDKVLLRLVASVRGEAGR